MMMQVMGRGANDSHDLQVMGRGAHDDASHWKRGAR